MRPRWLAIFMATVRPQDEWTITEVTRSELFERLVSRWSGRLEEHDFLSRLWDLSLIPSEDGRFQDAAGDILQHRVRNYDWPDDWVFTDARFLAGCSDTDLVRFLVETVHPLVRPDRAVVKEMVDEMNELLRMDGWELAETSAVSGRPIFTGRRRESFHQPADALKLDAYSQLSDPGALREHLQRIERDLLSDPPGAISASKELVESVLKFILDDYGVEHTKRDDLPALYKKVQKVLRLNAEAVAGDSAASKAAVEALRALVSTVQGLAQMRNAMGLGHGRTKASVALTRHARLAFNATVAVVEFLLDTWRVRREEDPPG